MESLVFANVSHRPVRTLVSILGVSVGVILVLMMTGLVRGMINDRVSRESKSGAEIIFRQSGSSPFAFNNAMPIPLTVVDQIRKIDGVAIVSPVGQFIQASSSGLGFFTADGIDYDSYTQISGMQIISGTPFQSDNDVIIDQQYSQSHKVGPGGTIKILDQQFRVAGIYAPENGFRVKLRLSKLQSLLSSGKHCSVIYIKCAHPEDQEAVARRISDAFPDNQIIFTRDLPQLYNDNFSAASTFLNVIVVVAVIVSTLTILLAMYTAVTERTREIGILKALGASNSFIVFLIEKEALVISVAGIVVGYLISLVARAGIMRSSILRIEFETHWLLFAFGVALFAGLLGSLYPAMRAARQDAVVALAYE
ncbi:MAG TPA: FtsX-like permease family protein [Blastocatellia bacterium]|nr:FtsX-like permease family protein [Blastocatellia bacterium]